MLQTRHEELEKLQTEPVEGKSIMKVTRFKNKLGDKVVVFPGYSDWGQKGFFLGYYVEIPGRDPIKHSVFFFETEEEAIAQAKDLDGE